ncbi:glycosyltransferase involved in cell wall biosynthesis [Microbacterium resistens]|uniref:Glycosyltransferase involved in cell wall biosynthesis n=1 Tax=Microbacterium resistens TaxID=156977 RepID=A0ABU1SC96_9MICO|nr:glycosyltransferase family 4 protein [Microbacterium resistens]MDR6867241.1 glycosyltransferase involved in cell wall biosynthesis [Microbacterium resistens]
MHIVFVTESMEANSLGRTYCLWLLARALGWKTTVLTTLGSRVWGPLADSEFAKDVQLVSEEAFVDAIPATAELLVAVKPLPRSLGIAADAASRRTLPLLVDIDDPDLEIRQRRGEPLMAMLRWLRRPGRSVVDLRLHRLARTLPSIVSNPWLQSRYGGTLIPHAREQMALGEFRDTADLQVAFVGTRHPHKGVDLLRAAIAAVQEDEARTTLVITDDPPADSGAWESWVGRTTLAEGVEIARNADVVVLPSLPNRHAIGQLPVKLVDAMMLGRAVVVSDVPPLPWAVGDAGIVVAADDPAALAEALRTLRTPSVRRDLGLRARERAEQEFSVEALAARFGEACRRAVADEREPRVAS